MLHRHPDRRAAGAALARDLGLYAGRADALVLALPRGGVPVGFEVAKALNLPLDVFVVRKLGVPQYPELAMGAVASGGAQVLNREVIGKLQIPDEIIEAVARQEMDELRRRERLYRQNLPPLELRGRTIILVDDGLATGSTMRAAVAAVKDLEAARIVVAVPVASEQTCAEFAGEVDELVCPLQPRNFHAVGQWYEHFGQTSDEEVRELLAAAGSRY